MVLIPHLHLGGRCQEALSFYARALNASVDCVLLSEDGRVEHAEMTVHGQRVMLNDRCGSPEPPVMGALHLIVLFDSVEELKDCYERMKPGSTLIDPLVSTGYSPLTVGFFDRYGVWWGFMVSEPA